MIAPNQSSKEEPFIRRYEYENHTLLVADFGPESTPKVDVVGDTAIIVIDAHQHELDLPSKMKDTTITTNNGVVTLRIDI